MVAGTHVTRTRVPERFEHEAAFYAGPAAQPAALLPFVREGIAAGEPILVALLPERSAALREALGPEAAHVEWADMAELGANPARIIPRWREFVEDFADRPGRGIGEPAWPGRRGVELAEAALHESLLNLAFDDGPGWRLLCPYDESALPQDVLDEARRNHPNILESAPRAEAPPYGGHDHARALFGQRLPDAPPAAREIPFTAADLTQLRERVRAAAQEARLDGDTADDLVLAAHEMATNSVLHGQGHGQLLWWLEPGALAVEIRDSGRIDDPLVGRSLADPFQQNGRGIWMANQLCDFVQVRSGASGTQVRLWSWR